MQLTLHTDYALRTLIYLGCTDEPWVSVKTIAESYKISGHHLTKVAQQLAAEGYVESKAGRTGGIRLAKAPEEINIGQVVRQLETNLAPVVCLQKEPKENCPIAPACALMAPLARATQAFLAELDKYSLRDSLGPKMKIQPLLGIVH